MGKSSILQRIVKHPNQDILSRIKKPGQEQSHKLPKEEFEKRWKDRLKKKVEETKES